MTKKYKLVKEKGTYLKRLVALKDFGIVKKGDKGGLIEKEGNLSHEDNAWVYGDARVSGDARVYGDARVSGDAWVYGNARVYGIVKLSSGWFCSRFNFEFDWQVKLWLDMEKKFETALERGKK
jgi:hypothetical protein